MSTSPTSLCRGPEKSFDDELHPLTTRFQATRCMSRAEVREGVPSVGDEVRERGQGRPGTQL